MFVCARAFLRQFLVGEEGLGLAADGVGAQRAAKGQLAGTRLIGLQVGVNQVCQCLSRTNIHY